MSMETFVKFIIRLLIYLTGVFVGGYFISQGIDAIVHGQYLEAGFSLGNSIMFLSAMILSWSKL